MTEIKITFCNRAYADNWYKMLRRQNVEHFAILQAIIDEIEIKDGADISKQDVFRRNPNLQQKVDTLRFNIIPARGQMLRHSGNGIRHAKFAPSKSIAVIWEKIGHVIFITFDDHAPIRYHRAIRHLRDIKLGRPALPKRARNSARFLKNLKTYWKFRYSKDMRKFNPRQRYYE
jgi:hypothetical protein